MFGYNALSYYGSLSSVATVELQQAYHQIYSDIRRFDIYVLYIWALFGQEALKADFKVGNAHKKDTMKKK